ncbi:MAG: hypothetical protein Q8O12_01075 [Candidatus Omnitrophota bacterium]|nr:hypothetical protein [Candidatus Omnitrophota bacterium]
MRHVVIISIVILMVGLFYGLTIREGHDWGDDFGMYIHHAKNIAEGISYKDTGYIYNPFNVFVGPRTYPPVFPILLSPVYRFYGLNLTALKIEIILMFLAFLAAFFLIFRKEIRFKYMAAMILILGLCPYFWDFKDNIASDIPFIFLLYLSFLFIHRLCESIGSEKSHLGYSVIAGFLMYLCYGTRSIGLVIPLSFIIYSVIRYKKVTRFSIIALSVFVFFVILQGKFLHSDTSYFDMFVIDYKVIARNLFQHIRGFSIIFDNGYSKALRGVLFAIASMFAIYGYVARIRQKVTLFEIFVVLYTLAVSVQMAGHRYLIPVIPLYVFYMFTGIETIALKRRKAGYLIFIAMTAVFLISYAGKYSRMNFGPMPEGVAKKETIELFDYIKNNTQKSDVLIFKKPRALALYTGRQASVYYCPQDARDLWRYFRDINAAYLIAGEPFDTDRAYLRPFADKYKNNLSRVYSNPDFTVYKITYLNQ